VRSVLQPPAGSRGLGGGDKHQASILAVLDELGISMDEPVAQFWLGLTGEGNPSGLAMRAHRAAMDAPRPADETFVEFVNGIEESLDRLLKRSSRGMSASSRGWTRPRGGAVRGAGQAASEQLPSERCLLVLFLRACAGSLACPAGAGWLPRLASRSGAASRGRHGRDALLTGIEFPCTGGG
jgi:hypothetical protein